MRFSFAVTKSKCPSYVGVTGILLQETKHVFKILPKEDRLKVIPKLNCVFAVQIDGFIFYIYGSKFQLRSSERSAKKFKAKLTRDLSAAETAVWDPKDRGHLHAHLSAETWLGWFCF
uniref:Ribonuclease P protein subunit p29 n=1 Tax=Mustela putorius furo TaxID=9669 RepID=M3Y9S4_MUSPF